MSDIPNVTEINCETGETVTRPMTDAEFADWQAAAEANALAAQEAQQAQEAEEAHKASVLAKIAEVTGLTADDLKKALNA